MSFPVLLRKGYALLLMALALPVVLLVRALRPFITVRFGRLPSRRFGLFLANTEIYLCERDAGMHGSRTFDIFYHYLPISNYQVKKMWERTKKLHICPFARFMHLLDRLNCRVPGGERHTVLVTSDTDTHGLRAGTSSYLSFTPEEERLGEEAVEKLGISDGAPFVCFHARDSAYLDTVYPNYKWRYHDFRDSNIHNYIPATEELARRGYFMLRMGAVVKEALDTGDPKIIDYAIKARTDFMDVYLGAKCRFFLCDTVGSSSIPIVFRRPIAWVNYVQLKNMPTGSAESLLIPKKLWSRKEHRFLSFSEILKSSTFNNEEYEQGGIEPIENTPEEIAALVVEMDERLKGRWKASDEDEDSQKRFRALLTRHNPNLKEAVVPRIGAEFLRQNHELLQ